MKKEFKGLSIKSNLLIFSFCISLIPIAIITTIYTLHARSKLMHHQLNELTAIAESKRLHVQNLMELLKARTADFSTDWFIRNSFEKIVCRGINKHDAEIRLNKHLTKNKLPLYRHLLAVALVDKASRVASSTSEKLLGKDLSDHDVCMYVCR